MITNKQKTRKIVTLVVQFEDMICSAELNHNEIWTVWAQKEEMNKQYIFLGNSKEIFFTTKGSNGGAVNKLEYNESLGKMTNTEIIKLNGC